MKKYIHYIWLIIGSILLVFSNGRWILPLATWLAPVFILRFTRSEKIIKGILISLAISILALGIAYQKIIPVDDYLFYWLIAAWFGLIYWLPYLVDRLVSHRIKGICSTLIFPLAFVAAEYILILVSPFSSWGSIAYTQTGNLPLIQLASITGILGITFIITWFASIVNYLWEKKFTLSKNHKVILIFGGVFLSIMIFGIVSLAIPIDTDNVKVGLVAATPEIQAIWVEALNNPDTLSMNNSQKVIDYYLEKSKQESDKGAKIISWSEGAIFLPQGKESEFVEQIKLFAKENQIYLFAGILIPDEKEPEYLDNKVIFISPQGEFIWDYFKSKIVPGDNQISGDGKLKIEDTSYGRLSVAICFDLANPILTRQSGVKEIDILFGPSDLWKGSKDLHMQILRLRAIENGLSLVVPANEGISGVIDYHGRILAEADYFKSENTSLIVEVPSKSRKTIYSMFGDLFAWLCIISLLILIVFLVVRNKKASH